jgi:hypothetical protein
VRRPNDCDQEFMSLCVSMSMLFGVAASGRACVIVLSFEQTPHRRLYEK